jgi:predicted transcriptional regulator
MDGPEQIEAAIHTSEETLERLRLSAGLDVETLARKACLSVAQIKQLESGASDSFYSESIRSQASRRVMAILRSVVQAH